MKVISAIYMPRRNFWCMTRGGCQQKNFNSRREMEDSQEARTWWKQWIWVEKLIFPVSVTQKEQLSGVFIFDFEKSAFLAHPILVNYKDRLVFETEKKRGMGIWSFLDIRLHNSGTWCPILVKFCMWSAFLSLKQGPLKLRSSDLCRGQSSKQTLLAKLASNIERAV